MDPRLKLKNKGDGYHPQLRLEENQLIQGVTEELILQGVLDASFSLVKTDSKDDFALVRVQGNTEDAAVLKRAFGKADLNRNLEVNIQLIGEQPHRKYQVDDHSFDQLSDLINYLASSN